MCGLSSMLFSRFLCERIENIRLSSNQCYLRHSETVKDITYECNRGCTGYIYMTVTTTLVYGILITFYMFSIL